MTYRYGQKLQTRKMNVKKLIAGAAASLALVTGAAVPALATSVPANFPSNCDAGHGAPGGLGKNSPYYWVQDENTDGDDNNSLPNGNVTPSGGATFGQEQGVNTGQTNSSASAYCQSL